MLQAPAVQRACRFAFDTIALAQQLSKSTRQPFQFQVGIHCPSNIATGIMGSVRTNLIFVGSSLLKTELIANRTQPMQVCISKECYETLASLNIHHNIKVKETIKMDNSNQYENIYELLDKRK